MQTLQAIVLWFWKAATRCSEMILQAQFSIVDGFCDMLGVDFSPVRVYLEAANFWFPVGEALLLLQAYIAFRVWFAIIKITIKLIPTVG